MSQNGRKNDWTVLAAIVLIVVGAWMLLGRVAGPWWSTIQTAFAYVLRIGWPIALIAAGILLLVASKRGAFSDIDTSGKRLYRSRSERMVSGVLGGLGVYLNIDPTWLRIGYVLLAVFSSGFPAIVLYIIATIVIPEEPVHKAPEPKWPSADGTETVQSPPPAPPVPPAPPAS